MSAVSVQSRRRPKRASITAISAHLPHWSETEGEPRPQFPRPPPDMVEILAAEAWLLGKPQDAVNQFVQVSKSPLISADTYMTVLRISYAAGFDDVARFVADLALKSMAADDPRRPRVEFLLDKRLPKTTPAKPTAAN